MSDDLKHTYLVTRQEKFYVTAAIIVNAVTTDAIQTCEDLLSEIRHCIEVAYKSKIIPDLNEMVDYAVGDFNIGDLSSIELQDLWSLSPKIKSVELSGIDVRENNCWNYDTVLHTGQEDE